MIERTEYLEFLKKLKDKQIIKVVTGIRRCGKSTLFELYKQYLFSSGVEERQIISLNFENPKENIFSNWKELYSYIDERLLKNKQNYIFLDEIQILPEFEKAVDGIYNTVLMKDVVSRNNIKDTMILESVIKFVFDNIGQIVSTNKISNTLNSNNRKNSVNTVDSYLSNLLDSYIIYKISRYDIKGKEHLKTGDKYYVCDLGLRNYLLGEIKDYGSILENIIFLELKRKGYDIYIGKYEENEVDFVIKNNDGIKYIQVALSVRDEKTLERELRPLDNIKDHYPKYIITLDYDINDYNGIKQISALDFLTGRVDI